MARNRFGQCVTIGLVTLVCCACGGSKDAAPAPTTEAAGADGFVGFPSGWRDANDKSAEYYRAGNYAQAVAVLEEFAKAHPTFADVELMLGDNWLSMPSGSLTPEAERLEKAATHLKRGLELATDDYGRLWANSSLARVAKEMRALEAQSKR